jgi:hypothetical protein
MRQTSNSINYPWLKLCLMTALEVSLVVSVPLRASAQTVLSPQQQQQPSPATGTTSEVPPPPGYKIVERADLLGNALRYQKLASDSPSNIAHLVRLSLNSSELRLVISPENKKGSTPSDLALADSSIVSLNGSFFDDRMRALGLVVSRSLTWKGSRDTAGYYVFGCINAQTCSIETDSGFISAGGPRAPFETAISGRPILVRSGAARTTAEDAQCPQFCDKRHPRAAIALDRSRKEVILALAEGRQALAQGYTLAEFGALLTQVGAYDAVNLDGGGSATLIINGKRVSGRPFGEKTERPVVNVISIVKP